jgi:hypothetical protein
MQIHLFNRCAMKNFVHFPNAKTHLLSGVLTFFFFTFWSLQAQANIRYVKPTAGGSSKPVPTSDA